MENKFDLIKKFTITRNSNGFLFEGNLKNEIRINASNIFFSSDLHLSSNRHLEYCNRPFSTSIEMDLNITKNFNNSLNNDSLLILLGDIGDYKSTFGINSRIVLLAGNYERKNLGYKIDEMNRMIIDKRYYNIDSFYNKFLEITYIDNTGELKEKYDMNKLILLCTHEPSNFNEYYEELLEYNKNPKEVFKLYGHIHGLQKIKNNAMDVGIDCNNYAPISLVNKTEFNQPILFYKNAINKGYYDNNVTCVL